MVTGRNKRKHPDNKSNDHVKPNPTTLLPAKCIQKPNSATREPPGPVRKSDRSKSAKKPPARQKQK